MSVCGQGVLCCCCGAVVQLNMIRNKCLWIGFFVLALWCSDTVEFWFGMSVCGQGVLCWCCTCGGIIGVHVFLRCFWMELFFLFPFLYIYVWLLSSMWFRVNQPKKNHFVFKLMTDTIYWWLTIFIRHFAFPFGRQHTPQTQSEWKVFAC